MVAGNISNANAEPSTLGNCAFYIPAKGQSLSIPRKNLVAVGDRLLVQLPIEIATALGAPTSHILVSTEDATIANVARASGATVWDRPMELASQTATVREVLLHDAMRLRKLIGEDGIVAVLLPTSPFRRAEEVLQAVQTLQARPEAHGLVSVTPYPSPVSYRLELPESGGMLDFPDGDEIFSSRSRRQQHTRFFYPDGAIYCVRIGRFIKDPRFFVQGHTLGQISSPPAGLDIDSIEDLEFAHLVAEKISRQRQANG